MRARIFLRRAGRVALAGFAALALAACGVRPAEPIAVPGGAPTAIVTAAPTAAPAAAPTAAPTTAPTAAPTAGTAQPGLVGPEWTKIAEGDFDRNGRADVVAYKPANVASQVTTENGFLASEVVIVERRADGAPAVRLLVTRDGVSADNKAIGSFGSGDNRPAGIIVRLNGAERKLTLTQLNRAGQQYAQDVAVGYADAQGAYIIFGPGGAMPTPLVGPEWTVISSGDINSNGVEDVVATKPTDARPSIGGRQHSGFGGFARELVVVERASHGGANMLLFADLREIRGGGQTLRSFDQAASGLMIFGSAGVLEIIPFSGPALMPGSVKLGLNADGRLSVLDAQPPIGQQPVDQIALGPEWLILDRSDRNRDGIADALAYIPSSVPVSGAPGVPEVAVSEMGIFQNTTGATEAMASLAQGALYAGGYLIHTFGDGMGTVPAAYLVSPQGDGVVITPLGADGAQSGQAVLLSWSPSIGAYTATPL